MENVRVELGERSYDILISSDWLSEIGDKLRGVIPDEKVLIVTDDRVGSHYADIVLNSLLNADFVAETLSLPEGEENKVMATVEHIYNFLAEYNYPRGCTLLALGGGVIGDITGFAAATYMRGVHYVQAPTSLLAMVDSSVGGKTGVNHPLGKNLIGAFYQPRQVFIDTSALKTLEEREFKAGMAEVIKYGVIRDAEFFEYIIDAQESIMKMDAESLIRVIKRCCEIKSDVVSEDEREKDVRAILNFGHTVGHAIEALTNYIKYRHGEAVAMGMIAAARIGVEMDMINDMQVQRLWQLILKTGLPYHIPPVEAEDIYERMKKDKKVRSGTIRFVLPEDIGRVALREDVPKSVIIDVLDNMKE